MAGASTMAALRQVDRLLREGTLCALADDGLLDRFLDEANEDAFAAIVGRHGAMVLRTCLDFLRDSADAEDAFQATFLPLIRRGKSIRGRDCLGGWRGESSTRRPRISISAPCLCSRPRNIKNS